MSDILNLILEPLKEVFRQFMAFLPNLLAMLVILIVGIMLARLLRVHSCPVPESGQFRRLGRPDGRHGDPAQRRPVGKTVHCGRFDRFLAPDHRVR